MIAPVVDIVASYQAVEALKYLVDADGQRRNSLITFDVWNNHYYEMKLGEPTKNCPCCQLKQYPALDAQNQAFNPFIMRAGHRANCRHWNA